LKIAALKAQAGDVQSGINMVDSLLPVSVAAESDRAKIFTLLPPLATRVQAAAIVLGLPDAIIVHVKEVVRKIRGQRTRAIKPDENGDTGRHVSVSQVSFNEQMEHLNQLISLVSSQAAYAPAEEELTVTALNELLSSMRAANDLAIKTAVPLANARAERNQLLYTPKTGMMATALAVKEYVKAVFGTKSPQYDAVKHIKFTNKKL
jgi:hypothetical protein